MIITTLKQLPFDTFTGWLVNKEEDITQEEKDNPNKYVWISKSPKMIIIFTPYVEEISDKITNKTV